jgi:hypothetical protein
VEQHHPKGVNHPDAGTAWPTGIRPGPIPGRAALGERAMRPVRTIAVVVFVAAIAVTGCAAHSAVHPSPAPSSVVDQAPLPVLGGPAPAPAPAPTPPVLRVPVLADGQSRDRAQVLSTYVRNHNPRLRTLPLASDARLDLHGGCEEPVSHQLARLAANARAMSGPVHSWYFTLTVAGGVVQRCSSSWPTTPAEPRAGAVSAPGGAGPGPAPPASRDMTPTSIRSRATVTVPWRGPATVGA